MFLDVFLDNKHLDRHVRVWLVFKSIRPVQRNQPIRLPSLKPWVCSGLILSGAFNPGVKIGVWRRRTYQFEGIKIKGEIKTSFRRGR